jgi:hypothetical protein
VLPPPPPPPPPPAIVPWLLRTVVIPKRNATPPEFPGDPALGPDVYIPPVPPLPPPPTIVPLLIIINVDLSGKFNPVSIDATNDDVELTTRIYCYRSSQRCYLIPTFCYCGIF